MRERCFRVRGAVRSRTGKRARSGLERLTGHFFDFVTHQLLSPAVGKEGCARHPRHGFHSGHERGCPFRPPRNHIATRGGNCRMLQLTRTVSRPNCSNATNEKRGVQFTELPFRNTEKKCIHTYGRGWSKRNSFRRRTQGTLPGNPG